VFWTFSTILGFLYRIVSNTWSFLASVWSPDRMPDVQHWRITVPPISLHALTCKNLEDTVLSLYKLYNCYGCYASMWWCMKLDFVSKAINMLYWAICHGWTPLSLNHWGEKDDYFDSLESAATSIKNILSDLVNKSNWGCVWGRIKIYLVMKLLFLFVSCNLLLQS